MPRQINIYEAKSQLSRLVDDVEAGAEIVIARNGRPAARIVPLARAPLERKPGSWKGKGRMAPDADETPEAEVSRG
jgi:prevent-host-death family protein